MKQINVGEFGEKNHSKLIRGKNVDSLLTTITLQEQQH